MTNGFQVFEQHCTLKMKLGLSLSTFFIILLFFNDFRPTTAYEINASGGLVSSNFILVSNSVDHMTPLKILYYCQKPTCTTNMALLIEEHNGNCH